MKKVFLYALLTTLFTQFTYAQKVQLFLRGGATFTNSSTTRPAHWSRSVYSEVSEAHHVSDGLGAGAVAGAGARIDLGKRLFIQTEVNYMRFALKQRANFMMDVSREAGYYISNELNLYNNNWQGFEVPTGTVMGNAYLESINSIDAINIPIMIGKYFAKGKLRVYGGPSVFIINGSEKVFRDGLVNTGVQTVDLPGMSRPVDVNIITQIGYNSVNTSDKRIDDMHSLRRLTLGVEAGAGLTLPFGLDLDLRYSLPTMLHRRNQVKGLVGVLSLSLGFHIGCGFKTNTKSKETKEVIK